MNLKIRPAALPPAFDTVNAFCRDNHVEIDPVSDDGPLRGLTFAAKDVFEVKGTRTGFGQPDWLRTHPPAESTSPLIETLLGAGARMIGRTISDELAYSLTGANHHYGAPVNTVDPTRLTGGSSSGSAAAVAASLCDFALGSDCGGSIRVPASYCGLHGIRPSHGRLPLASSLPFAPSFDVAGWFARDPALFAVIGGLLLDPASAVAATKTSVVFLEDGFEMLDVAASEALAPARAAIQAYFATTSSLAIGRERLTEWRLAFQTIQAFEIWSNHGDWIRLTQPGFGPGVRERFERASTISSRDAEAARETRERVKAFVAPRLRDAVLCVPTVPFVAPSKVTASDEIETEYRNRAMSLLCIAGLCGLPQVSMPLGFVGRLPIGLSLVGAWGTDEALLDLAATISKEVGKRAR